MIELTVIASAILTVVLYLKKRGLEAKGGRRLLFHLCDKSLEFLIPFTAVGALFLLLSLIVSGTSDSTTIENLRRFETLVGVFKGFVSYFKVGPLAAAGLLVLFYCLSLTRIPTKYTSRLLPFYKKTQKMVKWVYAVVFILCSFTFFGTQSEQPAATLGFRIKDAEGKYGALRREVREALTQQVAQKLLAKIKSTAPPDYHQALDKQEQYHAFYGDLVREYGAFKSKYGQTDDAAEGLTRTPPPPDPPAAPPSNPPESPKPERPPGGKGSPPTAGGPAPKPGEGGLPLGSAAGERIKYQLFEDGEPPPAADEPPPPEASSRIIDAATNDVRSYRLALNENAAVILKSEHGRELVALLPKTFTGKFKEIVLKSLTERYPILEPLLDAFVATAGKDIEERTLKAADKLADSMARNPHDAPKMMDASASEIVKETQVSFSTDLLARARKVGAALQRKVSSLSASLNGIRERANEIEEVKAAVAAADKELENLVCRNEGVRVTASNELAKAGPYLREAQVETIKEILYADDSRYRKSPGHPDLYEEVPVRYYAALTLRHLESPFLSDDVKEVAANVIHEIDSVPFENRKTVPSSIIDGLGLADP